MIGPRYRDIGRALLTAYAGIGPEDWPLAARLMPLCVATLERDHPGIERTMYLLYGAGLSPSDVASRLYVDRSTVRHRISAASADVWPLLLVCSAAVAGQGGRQAPR